MAQHINTCRINNSIYVSSICSSVHVEGMARVVELQLYTFMFFYSKATQGKDQSSKAI